jgi:hypothetical protein
MTRIALLGTLLAAAVSAAGLGRVELTPGVHVALAAEATPVYKLYGNSVFLPLDADARAALAGRGWQVELLDEASSPGEYYLVPMAGRGRDAAPGRLLWQDDRSRLVRLDWSQALAAKSAGYPLIRLRETPCPLPRPEDELEATLGPDTGIARIVGLVDQDSLLKTLGDLVAFGTRYSYYDSCAAAALYLGQRLADLGWQVRLDTYYLATPTTLALNVEATLPGNTYPESIVVACGHFDTYCETNQNDAPGADDNGTGTAACVELARVLKTASFDRTIKLLLFSGEEQWMKGSYHWVESTAVPGNLKITAAYNLDMFGYAAYDTNLVFINTDTASRSLANLCDSANNWYGTGLRIVNYLDEDIYGDNTPFWERGFRSVFALEDSEWGIWNGSNPHYHTTHDTIGNLTMSLVTRTTRNVTACVATLAGRVEQTAVMEPGAGAGAKAVLPTLFAGRLRLAGREREAFTVCDPSGRNVGRFSGSEIGIGLSPGVYFIRPDGDRRPLRVVKTR